MTAMLMMISLIYLMKSSVINGVNTREKSFDINLFYYF